MRILVTNDDGINAPGLKIAEAIAAEIAGPDGEVITVAPATEKSGVSHAVSFVHPMRIEQFGPNRYAVEGTPADCVLAALGDVLKETPPDLVLSGVNKGHNVAEDTLYSGTIGAAMEAVMHGVRAVAMSQYYGPANRSLENGFVAASAIGAKILRQLLEGAAWDDERYSVFYNINFPPVGSPADIKGVKATFQGHRPAPSFIAERFTAVNRRTYLWLGHGAHNEQTEPGSDSFECLSGYATVTPLRADLTARSAMDQLEAALGR